MLTVRLAWSFVAGAALVAAFAPMEWAFLAFACFAVLLFLVRECEARSAFWLGLAFGLGQFGFGVSWVYVSLHTYGGMPLWMGSIAVVLFSGILALFTAFATYIAARIVPQGGAGRLLLCAAAYVAFEWLRSWIFTGFPWLELGYTQTPTWLFGLAPIGGIYLISFSVALLSCCAVIALVYQPKVPAALTIIGLVALAWASNSLNWSNAVGPELNVGLVQGNTDINEKWQPQNRDVVIARFADLTKKLSNQGKVDLVIWPETAVPLYYQQTDSSFWQQMAPADTALLTGLLDSPQPQQTYNAAVLSCQKEQSIYRKQHLVPFGEYLPMRFLFNWVLEYLQLPMSDLSSWQAPQSLSCGENINIGLSICYEDAFTSELRRSVGDATVLVNISEDAWFGDSLAPHQRVQMAQMRARELARPMLRSANTGPSVVINEKGEILASTPQFSAETLLHKVQPQTGETPYKRFGNWIVWLCLLFIGTFVYGRAIRLRK